ncbi:PBSX family phage terminase large subunit [Lacticaseibacillus paracasei]|uniref:PBSX family phage terminase large subunit n=1 Tax=Lacticaseibacillus paracasei TaxID=1597 RepID=UPI000D7085D2|nr:PBSX family phage terminase large subunit [Lacticaseibacillus paracasei]AWN84608.1 PBSX family phage terminase large subunit [Lacticaseibacillus paracasei]
MTVQININLDSIVPKAYAPFYNDRTRYLVYKGSRGSRKSFSVAEDVIMQIILHPYVNWIVLRQYAYTNKDSTYSTIQQAANRLGVYDLFKFTLSPLEITFKPTGQKVFFRGMDKPLAVTSLQPTTGVLARAWWEEAYELKSLDAFKTVEETMRGEINDPDGYYQSIITFNPWSDQHWLKREFFDEDTKNPRSKSFTTTYEDNPYLDDDYIASLKDMIKRNPNRARVAVYGDWGIAEGLVFDGIFEQRDFNYDDIAALPKAVGLDFGYKHDPTAGEFMAIDQQNRVVYIYDEFYQQGMLTQQIAEAIGQHKGYGLQITADSAEQRLISELSGVYGVPNIIGAGKGKDSVSQGIQYMQSYHFVVHPRVKGLLEEFNTYVYSKDKFDNWTNTPVDANNHAIDALRYAMEPFMFRTAGHYMSNQERIQTIKNLGLG